MKLLIKDCFNVEDFKTLKMRRCPMCQEKAYSHDEFTCGLTGKDIELTDNEDLLESKTSCQFDTITDDGRTLFFL